MQTQTRCIAAICLFIVIAMMPCVAYAFEPAWLTIMVANAPDELKYLDILVPRDMKEIHMDYMNKNTSAAVKKAMAGYEIDGFVSYSLYFEDANCINELKQDEMISRFALGQYHLLSKLKIVSLDHDGQILQISGEIDITPDFVHRGGIPEIAYSYADNKAQCSFRDYSFIPFWLLITGTLVLFAVPSILVSVALKLLISLLLKVQTIRKIIILSLATQGLIALATPFLTCLLPFWAAFAAMELLSISAESIVLVKKATQPARPRLLLYLLVANTVTATLNALVFGGLYGFFRL